VSSVGGIAGKIKLLTMKRSKIRDNKGVTDFGRRSVKALGLLTFATGVIKAFFQCSGGLPLVRDRLKICVITGAS